MKHAIPALCALIVGGLVGGYFGGAIGGKGGTVLGMCEMAKVAVARDFLTQDKLHDLAEATGKDMQKNYPAIAKRLRLSETERSNASKQSDCSQFLVRLSAGMDAAK